MNEVLEKSAEAEELIYTTGAYTVGTPFLFKEYKKGKVFFSDSSSATGLKINYNCHTDELFHKTCRINELVILNSADIEYFTIAGDVPGETWVFEKIRIDREQEYAFLRVLYENKSRLLLNIRKEFIPADSEQMHGGGRTFNEYLVRKVYYIQKPGGSIHRVRHRRNVLAKILCEEKDKVKSFIRNKRLNLREARDLITLLVYYDMLIG